MERGGKDKLKRSVMTKSKLEGGLRAPDLSLIIEASRINWIKRYLSPQGNAQTWKTMVKSLFQQDGIDLDILLQSHFSVTQLNLTIPKFYIEMLNAWSKVSETEPVQNIYFLWYNQNITRDKKPVYYRVFYQLGIKYVTDLFDINKAVIPFNVWVGKGLPPSQFMNWAGLVSAATRCKSLIDVGLQVPADSMTIYLIKSDNVCMSLESVTSRKVYDILVNLKYGGNVHVPRIAKYVELDANQTWGHVFEIVHCSIDIKTRDFQYRFIHDILANNYWLKQWKIKDSAACAFCNGDDENIGHLFWYCNTIRHFWNMFNQKLRDKVEGLPLTMNIVFLGTTNKLLCTLVFMAKQYIYECKIKDQLPFFPQFVNRILFTKQIELQIAKDNNCVEKWLEKWEPML